MRRLALHFSNADGKDPNELLQLSVDQRARERDGALVKHRCCQEMDDSDRGKYPGHDQGHDGGGGIEESHRCPHTSVGRKLVGAPVTASAMRSLPVPAFAPSRLIEPLHARPHDWQRSSSQICTNNA